MSAIVSFFNSTTRPALKIPSAPEGKQFVHFALKNGPLVEILKCIKNGFWREPLQAIRDSKGGYEKNKTNLYCFTPSGTFRIRNDYDLLEYSNIVHLDYDKIDNLAALRSRIIKSPFCYAAFISPSGKGLKVFVRVNSPADLHQTAFTQVRTMFDALAGVKSDSSCRNLSRLCFISVDPDCYVNENSEVFNVTPIKNQSYVPDSTILANPENDKLFAWLYNLTKKGQFQGDTFPDGYSKDHRNNFIFLFACNCNRYGIDRFNAHEFAMQIWVMNNENFTMDELKKTVNSAYSYREQHATFNLPKSLRP